MLAHNTFQSAAEIQKHLDLRKRIAPFLAHTPSRRGKSPTKVIPRHNSANFVMAPSGVDVITQVYRNHVDTQLISLVLRGQEA
jgi:hypothetical protein